MIEAINPITGKISAVRIPVFKAIAVASVLRIEVRKLPFLITESETKPIRSGPSVQPRSPEKANIANIRVPPVGIN